MKIELKSRRTLVVCSVVFSLLTIVALSRLRVSLPPHDDIQKPNMLDVPGVQIFEGVSVTQEFIARDDNIASVALMLATYARENPGRLKVELFQRRKSGWFRLAKERLEKRQLVDNAFQVFTFLTPLNVHVGDQLALKLSADGPATSAITWRVFPDLTLPGHRMLVGEQRVPGTASFKLTYVGAKGRAGGPYMRGRLWKRITIFLHAPGQVLLIAGFLCALFSLVWLTLAPLPERASEDDAGPPDVN